MEDDRQALPQLRLFPAVSIHVPRVEDDTEKMKNADGSTGFNPRPPCGGRLSSTSSPSPSVEFQSTSPVWRTTAFLNKGIRFFLCFNPRPPCGGRPDYDSGAVYSATFQSTSPVWRTTKKLRDCALNHDGFNPRPPCGGRLHKQQKNSLNLVFQSTSPVWRTTMRFVHVFL